jgi:hypothetical protein
MTTAQKCFEYLALRRVGSESAQEVGGGADVQVVANVERQLQDELGVTLSDLENEFPNVRANLILRSERWLRDHGSAHKIKQLRLERIKVALPEKRE